MRFKESYSIKLILVALLALVLLIPTFFIQGTVQERKNRRNEAVAEIASKWGGEQVITGPFLSIPCRKFYWDSLNQKRHFLTRYHVLPQRLEIEAQLVPEIRYRGIYEAVLYTASIRIRGEINAREGALPDSGETELLWDKAEINVGISDLKGVLRVKKFLVDGRPLELSPGTDEGGLVEQGLAATLGESAGKMDFDLEIDLNGSGAIGFHPVGKTTEARVEGRWGSPSFQGAYLPRERAVKDSAFSARWKVLHLNRNYPQGWEGSRYRVQGSEFKVEFRLASDVYQKTDRVVKYALLFILITFVGFFFSEILNRKKIHPIQYSLIGFAVLMFYVLLLSISEHVGFDLAYWISGASVILLVSLYTWSILASRIFGAYIAGVLAVLYAYFYILLQLQDYALLIGSLGLFAVLGLFMYLTRRINWYKMDSGE